MRRRVDPADVLRGRKIRSRPDPARRNRLPRRRDRAVVLGARAVREGPRDGVADRGQRSGWSSAARCISAPTRRCEQLTELQRGTDSVRFAAQEGPRIRQVVRSFGCTGWATRSRCCARWCSSSSLGRPSQHGIAVGLLLLAALGFTIDFLRRAARRGLRRRRSNRRGALPRRAADEPATFPHLAVRVPAPHDAPHQYQGCESRCCSNCACSGYRLLKPLHVARLAGRRDPASHGVRRTRFGACVCARASASSACSAS